MADNTSLSAFIHQRMVSCNILAFKSRRAFSRLHHVQRERERTSTAERAARRAHAYKYKRQRRIPSSTAGGTLKGGYCATTPERRSTASKATQANDIEEHERAGLPPRHTRGKVESMAVCGAKWNHGRARRSEQRIASLANSMRVVSFRFRLRAVASLPLSRWLAVRGKLDTKQSFDCTTGLNLHSAEVRTPGSRSQGHACNSWLTTCA